MKKILLIDGNSIINRAYYALPMFKNDKGIFTGAVYGFLNIMFKFLDEEKPDYLAVAFDLKAKTFRHAMYEEYKGTRKSTPVELLSQIPLTKDLLTKMNIKIFEKEGFEADDILGTLSSISASEHIDVILVSGDRDMLQLATDKVTIKLPKTSKGKTEVETYTDKDVIEKYGVTPTQFIDIKGLMGDTSDNILGVPSIGEKTAVKIIQEYNTIENAIDNYEKITPKKASTNLFEYKDQALLSKKLATIIKDVPIEFIIEDTKINNMFNEDALEIMKELNFKTYFSRFEINTDTVLEFKYDFLEDIDEAKKFVKQTLKQKLVAYNLVNYDNKVIGISISYKNHVATFVLFNELNEKIMLEIFKPFFESNIQKLSLNSKFEKVYLEKNNILLNNIIFDAALAGYVINSSKTSYTYGELAYDFLKESYPSFEAVFGKGKTKKSVNDIDLKTLIDYGAKQADVLFRVYPVILDSLKQNELYDLYYNIELPLVDVLKDMELTGIKINKTELISYKNNLEQKLNILTEKIYTLAGEKFNINSPSQLGVVLFEKLNLKVIKKTKTGYSTDHDVLIKLKNDHDIINEILEYRTLSKLKSTYADGLLNVLSSDDKIYSTFNQFITTTGRISSTEPNLQNIPIKMDIGKELRKTFIPSREDYIFVDADYSQIELRVLASISGDETLINAFKNNEDIHRLTASQVFNVDLNDVTPKQRSNAKAVNFGIVYGIGSYSLSQDLEISKDEAEKYIEGYFEKYPKVKNYLEQAVAYTEETGYAKTLFNRRREVPEIYSSNQNIYGFGKRVAMNMPIQGMAADIIKIAMVKVHNRLKKENIDGNLILQVHDELLLEVNKNVSEYVKDMLKYEMEHATELDVPLEVDVFEGENWYETK